MATFDPTKFGATLATPEQVKAFNPAQFGATPVQAPTTPDTSSQEKFGGPAWLGSKQMSAQDFLKHTPLHLRPS